MALVTVANAFGYATTTHVAMTAAAVAQSNLTSDPIKSPIIERLGLTGMLAAKKDNPFWTSFDGDYVALTSPPRWLKGDALLNKKS